MSEKNCLIFFTKSPELGKCKTRLNDFLSLEEALNLQKYLIAKNYAIAKKFNSIVFYDGELKKLQEIINKVCFFAQKGSNIGEKMAHAFEKAFELGYEKVVLIGSDLDNLSSKIIKKAYKKLDKFDAVFAPSDDGGYSLIGLNRAILSQIYTIFNIKFSHKFVFRDSLKLLKNNKFTILKPIKDIDTKFDIFAKFIKTNKIKFLASGEYNSNYLFKKGGKKWLLRINHASQMGLKDQISYEYNALKILQKSGVTPKVYKIFSKSEYLPNGALVMEYLKGRSLVYETDLKIAS